MNIITLLAKTTMFFLLMLSIASCSKEDIAPSDVQSRIIGRWTLQQTSGGISGSMQPANPNQKRELIFTSDGRAEFLLNGKTEVPTGYTIQEKYNTLTGKQETIVDFGAPLSSYAMSMTILELTPLKLTLQEDYADGQRYDYSRL
jgi:hypothetical protein